MKKPCLNLLTAAIVLVALVVPSLPAFAADSPSFWERLAKNYGDPKNWLIGAAIGLGIGIFAMLGKKKK